MNNAFQNALARIIDPLVLRTVLLDDCDTKIVLAPRPEPEIIAIARYHQGMVDRNFVAAAFQREALVALETEVLLTVADSFAIGNRARTVRPLLG